MWLFSLFSLRRANSSRRRPARPDRLTIEVLEDRNTPSFLAPVSYAGGGRDPALGDFNNDGIPDLVGSDYPSNVSVRLGNGDGTFGAARTSAINSYPHGLVVGDFNRDGKLDLVVLDGSALSTLLGNGDGTFQPPRGFSLPVVQGDQQTGDSLAVGDLNGDGRLDLVVTADGPPLPGYSLNLGGVTKTYVNVLLGQGNGSFTVASTKLLADKASSYAPVALGDFNSDSKVDVLASAFTVSSSWKPGSSNVYLLLGQGSGGLGTGKVVANGVGGNLAVADLNADGKLDFAASAANVGIFLGNGRGGFQAGQTLSGYYPEIGDFNRDGTLDIATADAGIVSVYLGKGDGTFKSGQSFDAETGGYYLAVGDLNGDGFLDLALGHDPSISNSSSFMLVLLNDGSW
jgi:hypothetical protein